MKTTSLFFIAITALAQVCPPGCVCPMGPMGATGATGSTGATGAGSLGSNILTVSQLPGIHGNSNVVTGGGTDDTAVLQTALNTLTSNGGGVLIVDRACLTSGLQVGSNTTIYAPGRGYGFFLSSNAGFPVIRNVNPSTSTVIDQNISLIGGTYNMNVANQNGPGAGNGDNFQQIAGFYGVANVTLRDLTLTSGTTGKALFGFGVIFSNWSNVVIQNVVMNNNRTSGGGDGVHLLTGSGATITNLSGFTTSDFIALNSSDYHDVTPGSWIVTDGNISNVSMDDIQLNGSWNGIGMLSGDHNVTGVAVNNLRGTVLNYAISMWNAWASPHVGGFVDGVSLSNINVTCATAYNASGPVGPIAVVYSLSSGATQVRNVQINGVQWNGQGTASPWMLLAANTTTASLQINGVQINESTVNTNNRPFVSISGTVNHLAINNVDWQRPTGSTPTSGILANTGTLNEFSLTNVNAPLLASNRPVIVGCGIYSSGDVHSGIMSSTESGNCTTVLTFQYPAQHSWVCSGSDVSNSTALVQAAPSTTTQCIVAGTTSAGDTLTYSAVSN